MTKLNELVVPNRFSRNAKTIKVTTPIGQALAVMAYYSKEINNAAEIFCMLAEVEEAEKRSCAYCKTVGHIISECPT